MKKDLKNIQNELSNKLSALQTICRETIPELDITLKMSSKEPVSSIKLECYEMSEEKIKNTESQIKTTLEEYKQQYIDTTFRFGACYINFK